jgi:catechol 2,3-dioxygenase-like lactoylglutathione lyase family enzyme
MITKFSHVSLFVKDQASAYDFYVNKLGFEVRTDAKMDNGFWWLTVGIKTQPDLEIVLYAIDDGKPELTELRRQLLDKGGLGAGVFEVDDIHATYQDLVAKGVRFKGEPEEQFYGIEAIMVDDSGNWFSVTQRKPH